MNSFICTYKPYLSVNFLVCQNADVNECEKTELNDCGLNALCTNTNGSYSCRCKVGYQGDGVNCTGKDSLEAGFQLFTNLM